jgi:hypothetical protein
VKITQRKMPHPVERGVSSAIDSEAATGGWYVSPGGRGVYALAGRRLVGVAIAMNAYRNAITVSGRAGKMGARPSP